MMAIDGYRDLKINRQVARERQSHRQISREIETDMDIIIDTNRDRDRQTDRPKTLDIIIKTKTTTHPWVAQQVL